MKRVWQYLVVEPFTWIFYCFFQPGRFTREFEIEGFKIEGFWKRNVPMLRLALPMFLLSYPIGLFGRFIFLQLHLVSYLSLVSFLFETALGIAFGIVGGIAFGIAEAIALGIAFGITEAIALGIAFGIAEAFALGIAVGIAGTFAFGIAGGVAGGIAFGVAGGIAGGITGGIAGDITVGITVGIAGAFAVGIAFGIAGAFAVGITGGIAGDITVGIAFGIAFIVSYTIGFFRLPLYLVSGPATLWSYLASRKNPPQVFTYLQRSSLHWDERVYLPLPYLKGILFIAAEQNIDDALKEIAFIVAERPQQIRAAREVSLEIAMRDLEGRESLVEIAQASQRLTEILPQETKLMDPRWVTPFKRLNEASLDAARYCSPIGKQARRKALEDMRANLQKVYPNTAFADANLNWRLGQIVDRWLEAARHKLDELEQTPQDRGHIDNPYNPGNALKPHDPLFIGRRDLIQQLETALSKGSRRPTFLMNGERRMGKSSTLLQLPYLLGSRYLPVFYNLQNPSIFANTATFLGTIAEGIYNEMSARGMQANKLVYQMLQESRRTNDASAYRTFDRWLQSVESTLEQEDCTLLLLFDEFEKLEAAGQGGYLDLGLLLDWFRSVIQYRPRVALLFSGVRTLGEMGAETGVNWAGYFVNVQTLRVSFLKGSEARRLITRPVENYPSEEIFAEGVVDEIMRVTGCHPFLVQAVCSALVDNLNTDNRERAEMKDVEVAVKQVLENWWDTYFRDLWERTEQGQRMCLLAVRKLGKGELQDIGQLSGLDEKLVRNTMQALLKRDLVMLEDGVYRVAAPIFEEWVERNG